MNPESVIFLDGNHCTDSRPVTPDVYRAAYNYSKGSSTDQCCEIRIASVSPSSRIPALSSREARSGSWSAASYVHEMGHRHFSRVHSECLYYGIVPLNGGSVLCPLFLSNT